MSDSLVQQLLTAMGLPGPQIGNTETLAPLSGGPLADMTNALGGPAPPAPVIPAVGAAPIGTPTPATFYTDPTGTIPMNETPAPSFVTPQPTSPLAAAPTGPGDINTIISGLLGGSGLPTDAPAEVKDNPLAEAISHIGHPASGTLGLSGSVLAGGLK